jgi:hypothetical protein
LGIGFFLQKRRFRKKNRVPVATRELSRRESMHERMRSKSVSIGFEGLIELVDQHLMNALVEGERPDSVLE